MRLDPMIFWFLTTLAALGAGWWWITQNVPTGPREHAALGLLVVAALAFRAGMVRHR